MIRENSSGVRGHSSFLRMPITTNNPDGAITEETILQRYDSLPDDLKQSLMGVGTASELYKIGKNANLGVEKIGRLAEEVGLIILGLTPSQNFISDLKQKLEVTEEKAGEIASEVNARIFLPIRESLKRLHGASWSEGITKLPLTTERPRSIEEKKIAVPPPPPILQKKEPELPAQTKSEIKKPAMPPPTIPIEKPRLPGPTPSTPKEPLIIQPMGGAPTAIKPTLDREIPKDEARPFSPPPVERKPTPSPSPIQPPPMRIIAPSVNPETQKARPPIPPPLPPTPQKIPVFEKPALPTPPAPINPPTFSLDIEPREKVLRPPFIPAAKPQGIREDGGIKPQSQTPPPPQPGFDPYREPVE